MEQRDFFISYTKADKAEADWIAETLIQHGYSVYIQTRDIGPADSFVEKMEEFMDNSRNFIAVWSENYFHSKFAMWEFRAAFTAQRHGQMELLLPVCVEKYPLPRLYAHIVHADLYGVGEAEKMRRLLDAVGYRGPVRTEPAHNKTEPAHNKKPELGADELFRKGYNYHFGIGIEQDYTKAREYYQQAAEMGEATALKNLGILYEFGQGVEQDYIKAESYYQQAIEKGSESAPNNLKGLREKMANSRPALCPV